MPNYDIAMHGENFTNGYNHDIVIIKRSKLKWGEPYQNGLLLIFQTIRIHVIYDVKFH